MKISPIILSAVLNQLVSGEYASTSAMTSMEVVQSSDAVVVSSSFDAVAEVESTAPLTAADSGWNIALKSRAMDYIISNEKFNGQIHLDERGNQCVGYARNIDEKKRGRVSLKEANALLQSKMDKFTKLMRQHFPWTVKLDRPRYYAMLSMLFQMGVGNTQRGLKSFRKFLRYMEAGDFNAASVEMLDSGWAKRDSPNRARRLSRQVKSGEFVIEGYSKPPHASDVENFYLQIRVDEGFKPYAYLDTKKLWTFAIGYMIDPKEGGTISKEEGEMLVDMQLDHIVDTFNKAHPWWSSLAPARKVALTWFAYKVTPEGFLTFRNAWAALKAGNFPQAANEMLDSAFASASPTKARRITEMIRTGVYPAGMQIANSAEMRETQLSMLHEDDVSAEDLSSSDASSEDITTLRF